jgi:hypothetical protein
VWYKTIQDVFKLMGFSQCRADPCLFVRRDDHDDDTASPVFVVLYVNDLLVGSTSEKQVQSVHDDLTAHFTIKKTLGGARYVLGVEVDYMRE